MEATFVKSGMDFLPAIKSSSGKVRVLHGEAVATIANAKKYAQIEINRVNEIKRKVFGDNYRWKMNQE
jgi:hypothetical protein